VQTLREEEEVYMSTTYATLCNVTSQAYWNRVLEWKTPNRKQKEKVIPQTE
jgi:hypothetical protein